MSQEIKRDVKQGGLQRSESYPLLTAKYKQRLVELQKIRDREAALCPHTLYGKN